MHYLEECQGYPSIINSLSSERVPYGRPSIFEMQYLDVCQKQPSISEIFYLEGCHKHPVLGRAFSIFETPVLGRVAGAPFHI